MENRTETKQGFDFKTFIEDSKAVLLNPKDYFGRMNISGGYGDPVIKVLIYGAIIGTINFIWFSTGFSLASDISWFGGGIGIMSLFSTIIFSVIGLFIGGVILLVVSAILGGNTNYEANVRVVAALMVISVVRSLFGFVDSINLYLSAIVSIAISLWGLYISYQALTLALKAGEKGSKILIIILAVIIVITSFTGIAAKKALKALGDNYKMENMSAEEQQEAALKMVEKMTGGEVKAKDMQKVIEESKNAEKGKEEKKEAQRSKSDYVKPDAFPGETFAKLKEVLSDNSKLDETKLNKTLRLFDDINDQAGLEGLSEEGKGAKIDSIAKQYDFASLDDAITGTIQPALLSATILTLVTKTEGKTGSEQMLKAFLSQNPISLQDLKFTYDNWDKVMLLQDKTIK